MIISTVGELSEYQRKDLTHAIKYWLRKTEPEDVERIGRATFACFDTWKNEKIDKDGNVVAFGPLSLGLLAVYPNGTSVHASKAHPWHCAGPHIRNEIDLAFHLWVESYGPFDMLLKEHGQTKVFAICGALVAVRKNESVESLIRLNGYLTRHLVTFAELMGDLAMENLEAGDVRRRQDSGLQMARKQSAQNRRERAIQANDDIRRMAFEFFRQRPGDDLRDAIKHIRDYYPFSTSSIEKKIKGVKAAALRSLNTAPPTRG